MRNLPAVHVGNDIVDLDEPGARNRHLDGRFLSRAFTPAERRAIDGHEDPHRHLWSLWAAKETAYKAMVKAVPAIPAWPIHYETFLPTASENTALLEGAVRAPWGAVMIRLHRGNGYVHCVGAWGSSGSVAGIIHETCISAAGDTRGGASETARKLLIGNLSRGLGIAAGRFRILRLRGDRGLLHPLVLIDDEPSGLDISISHDGRFAAYARSA